MSWHDALINSGYYADFDPEDYEPDWRTLRQSTHTARLTHTCDDCGGIIQIGRKYHVTVALDEGTFRIIRSHDRGDCLTAEEQAFCEVHQREYDHYNNADWDDYWDEKGEDQP
jgi:hypothetical protein